MSYPLVVASSATANGWARNLYRERLARELGLFGRGSVSVVASGLEPEHYVISNNFRSDRGGPKRYDGLYLYMTGGDQAGVQRALVNGAFDGPVGAFMVDYPYDAILARGSTFEVSVLPAEEYLGVGGLNDAINRGLDTLHVLRKATITVTDAAQIEYSLANYAWPVKGIQRVFLPRSATTDQRRIFDGCRFDLNGESPVLVLPHGLAVNDTFDVELLTPASSRIRQSNVWGDSSTGLTSDTDQALYSITEVVAAAKPFALEYMAQAYERGSEQWAGLRTEARGERVDAAIKKFYGRGRRSGAVRVGTGGR